MDPEDKPEIPTIYQKLPTIKEIYTFPAVKDPSLLLALDAFKFKYPFANAESMMQIFDAVDKITKPYNTTDRILSGVSALLKDNSIFNSELVEKMTSFSKINIAAYDQLRLSRTYQTFQEQHRKFSSITSPVPIHELDPYLLRAIKYDLIQEQDENDNNGSEIILLGETVRIKKMIRAIYRDHQELYRLEPRDFEEMIAELLRKQDYQVELTKQTRDGGYDLIALQLLKDIPLRFLVECKRFSSHRKIGVDIIRSFSDVMTTSGNMGMICTSSYFSPDAISYKNKFKPYLLHLKDHDDIVRWVNQYII